jgi:trans-aconitate methyltransferase
VIRRITRAIVKRWGSPSVKRRLWDSEYATGRWTYDRSGHNNEEQEPIYGVLEAYAADNSILDLGCGSGMTALEMKNNFKEYVGVDVSEVAVEKAREALSRELDRAGKVSFVASDIYEFAPARKFSVILFRESIYYVPLHRIKSMLQRYSTHLLPNGVLIVRLCDRHRYKSIVKILELDFQGKEVFAANDSPMSIFICAPSDQGQKMRST